ncbi:hypothetical protein NE619_14465 [Anaerovorax odorimutans]|uniref:Uncharacterized protein n=2 Tax=Anaerovorax odorimutans TaxID=109327 RepID=A0ABT1RS09_9FIRM|nr:hypothetical protein [Anaerovorax odorimutans]
MVKTFFFLLIGFFSFFFLLFLPFFDDVSEAGFSLLLAARELSAERAAREGVEAGSLFSDPFGSVFLSGWESAGPSTFSNSAKNSFISSELEFLLNLSAKILSSCNQYIQSELYHRRREKLNVLSDSFDFRKRKLRLSG